MENMPRDQLVGNEAALRTQERQRMRPFLIQGLLAGLLAPVVLTPVVYYLIAALFNIRRAWFMILPGLWGAMWIGAIIFRIMSTQPSSRVFAKGMLIGLAFSPLCSPICLYIVAAMGGGGLPGCPCSIG